MYMRLARPHILDDFVLFYFIVLKRFVTLPYFSDSPKAFPIRMNSSDFPPEKWTLIVSMFFIIALSVRGHHESALPVSPPIGILSVSERIA
jgi:hypothetical protein